jgi:pimeloyl-ACP methyl ester carboxylesterase
LRGAESDLLSRATWEDMAQRGPRARLAEIPGVGHAPMLMDAAQIGIVRDFLCAR